MHLPSSYINILPLTGGLKTPLSYCIPEPLLGKIALGQLVRAPLGPRSVLGIALEVSQQRPGGGFKIRPISEIVYPEPIVAEEVIQMIPWIERYYAADRSSVLETLVPAALRQEAGAKHITYITWAPEVTLEKALSSIKKTAKAQRSMLEALESFGGACEKSTLTEISSSAYKALLEANLLRETQTATLREAYYDEFSAQEALHAAITPPPLTEEQAGAVDVISKTLDSKTYATHLLRGVTGSGKTEVYLALIEKALSQGRSVILLVPEVSLTPQTVARVRTRLAARGEKVMVWHSHLSTGQRRDAWLALASGSTRVLVGARSAVFAPVKNLGLIIVDEEHDSAYKQEESPRYNARDLAVYRAKLARATCILGSATPSLESLYNAQHKGYILSELTARVDDRPLPLIHVVDMRIQTAIAKGAPILSRPLRSAIRDRLEKREQSILFINRRGYSPKFLCASCGYVATCERCSITLTYHRPEHHLRCHLCAYTCAVPKACPDCKDISVHTRGSGTQRIEEVVQKQFPRARLERIDSDTLGRKDRFREILANFRRGELDILIGTQMIAKGLDFPNVTLVGLVDADISLHVPDFRATERTFQLLTQVSGRAGRGDRAGEVYIQTYTPESESIQFARHGDFAGWSHLELSLRKEYGYPPYRRLIRHLIKCANKEKLEAFCSYWARQVQAVLGSQVEVRGPGPAPIEKIKNQYRYQLWYFCPPAEVMHWTQIIAELRAKLMLDPSVTDALDVDPIQLS